MTTEDPFLAVISGDPPPPELTALRRARRVLGGLDETGLAVHPTMFDADVISFAHGEGVRRPPASVVAAGVRALLDTERASLENYLFLQRSAAFDAAAARAFERIGVPSAVAGNLVLDAGSTRLLLGVLHLLARPGGIVLTAPGYYHPLSAWCALHGLRLVCLPAARARSYKVTAADLSDWWQRHVVAGATPPPRLLMLFNPSICGAVYDAGELADIAGFLRRTDMVAVEDAIFAETEFAGTPGPRLAAMPGMHDRVLTVTGGSKLHGLANIRIAWACGPKPLIDRLDAHVVTTSATLPQVARLMALAALEAIETDPGYAAANRAECAWRSARIATLAERVSADLAAAYELPNGPAVTVDFPPAAGHAMLLSFEGLRGLVTPRGAVLEDSVDLVRFFLEEARVAFSPGLSIGWAGCRVRCTYACVGTPATFPASEASEAAAVLRALADWWGDRPGLGDAAAPLAQTLNGLADRLPPPPQSDFASGRQAIEEAFLNRVLPALHRLCAANGLPRRRHREAAATAGGAGGPSAAALGAGR